jgi:hypothetical protein
MAWLKYHCPFFDSYVLLNSKDEKKNHDCVIDRRFTKLSYQVFSMILDDSTTDNFESNLLNPEYFIHKAKNIRRKRKMKYDEKTGRMKTKLGHTHVDSDYRTEGVALESEGTKAITDSLKQAHEILFEADEFDLPLYASAPWQFCVDLKYNFEKIGTEPEEKPIAKFPKKIEDQKKKVKGVFNKTKEETSND